MLLSHHLINCMLMVLPVRVPWDRCILPPCIPLPPGCWPRLQWPSKFPQQRWFIECVFITFILQSSKPVVHWLSHIGVFCPSAVSVPELPSGCSSSWLPPPQSEQPEVLPPWKITYSSSTTRCCCCSFGLFSPFISFSFQLYCHHIFFWLLKWCKKKEIRRYRSAE